MASATNESAFTPHEQEVMGKAWLCFDGEPKVDYNKLAELCGMSNPKSASNLWSQIKKKLAAQAGKGAEGGTSPTKKATPKATPKRKKKAEGDDAEGESPTKKPKTPKTKGKKSAAKVEEDGEVQAEAEAEAPVKEEGGDELV